MNTQEEEEGQTTNESFSSGELLEDELVDQDAAL